MTQLYDELLSVLEHEFVLCNEMLELLGKEQEVILSLNATAIEELMNKKMNVTNRLKESDHKRESLLSQLGHPNKTISYLAEVSEPQYKSSFSVLAEKFARVVSDMTELNKLNGRLIKRTLFHLQGSASFLAGFNVTGSAGLSVEA
ncbi:MAG: flagellar protein FlgN [Nitrospiraceae bacterium]|nr:flagellar protein FlgN [Nitrospiraceae bacterium]